MKATEPAATEKTAAASLRITEIFHSLQGESVCVGLPTVFVRLTGCPLRCRYCDTAYAFTGGRRMNFGEILEEVARHEARHVTVTGGEPLAQRQCGPLLELLCDEGYSVSLETGGAMDIADVDRRVMKVMDIKTPASGEHSRNRWENLDCLDGKDQIKVVICDRADYEWAREQLRQRRLDRYCEVLFSPSYNELPAPQLAGWILEDRLPVRFQVQLHKILWGDEPGR